MVSEYSDKFKENWGKLPTFDEILSLKGTMYRQVARRKTFKFTIANTEYFAKIHRGVGWKEIFKNFISFRMPVISAANEYEAIHALTALDIKTMTLAAYGQRGANPAELESFVITESLEPSISLEDFCADWQKKKPSFELKRALIKRVAQITRQLHENGINHRDLYICHFLLKEKEFSKLTNFDDMSLYLIDLHRVQIRSKTPYRWQVKDLAALYFSSMDIGLNMKDLFCFVQYYTGNSVKNEMKNNSQLWSEVRRKALILKAKPLKG